MAWVRVATDGEASRRTAPLDFGHLSEALGFNVRMAQVAMHRDFVLAMKDIDLTPKQYAVLTLIGANPGVSQIDIALSLGVDRATMMAIVDRLQNRSFVERVPSKADRRRQELYLTREGEGARAHAEAACRGHEARFRERFTAAELDTLSDLLARLHAPPRAD